MSIDSLPTQTVVVSADRTAPSDDVTIVINGQRYGGWESVRITRGIERLPSDFELGLTDFYAGDAAKLQIEPGDTCVVQIGRDVVLTGYVDAVRPRISAREHSIVVVGRSKCADLVDCSAEWPGGQISGTSALDVARRLAKPYGIGVDALDDVGGTIDKIQLMRGETPFEIIERVCRFRQLLVYDEPEGNLLLARIATRRAGSGFREGWNVESATADYSQHDRFSEYRVFFQSVDSLQDLGQGGDLEGKATDPGVRRRRVRIIVAEIGGSTLSGGVVADARAKWEAARRYGRSYSVRLTTDAWRDKLGALYEPNTMVDLDLPSLKINGKTWAISEVTYRKDESGTHCDLTCMPREAFEQQLSFIGQLPAEFNQIPTATGASR